MRLAPLRCEASRQAYYVLHHDDFLDSDVADLVERLHAVHGRVFKRLKASLDGRPVILPLSGGYDSRLIATSLRDAGVREVTCYSYGAKDHWESKISREVAAYLGYRWEFVPYSSERWRTWIGTDSFERYFGDAGNLSSVPHVQDWPAVLELKQQGRLAPEAVFVPGHSGDFLAGSHIPKWFGRHAAITRRSLLDTLQDVHYSLWDWPTERRDELRRVFDSRIEAIVGALADCAPETAADAFERWDLQERQAKFICNSVRVYEHFGFDWRMPLFDHELMDFWARIRLQLRVGRRLYFDFVRLRQALPVTEANRDRGIVARYAVRAVQAAGLLPLSRRLRQMYRRVRWRDVYTGGSLAWFAIVDRAEFERTYTGRQLLHSYLADRYRAYAAAKVGHW